MGHLKGCLLDFCVRFSASTICRSVFPSPPIYRLRSQCAEVGHRLFPQRRRIETRQLRDWLEIAAAAWCMTTVLRNCGVDPDKYQGFAFGTGIERLAMLKYGIPDLRTFFRGRCALAQALRFCAA
jgi:phenylalanyl-tRNA synthetase alpha chain